MDVYFYREEDDIDNGDLMKAEIHPGEGEESPIEGSMVSSLSSFELKYLHLFRASSTLGTILTSIGTQVYVHVVVHGQDEDQVILSSRKEHGGNGKPYIYLLGSGNSRPLRGIELALLGMKKKERCIVLLKPGMGLMNKDIDFSTMGRFLTDLKVPKTEELKIDLELLGWSADVTSHSCNGKEEAIKTILKSGNGWENPRVPFDVRLKLEVRQLDSDGGAMKGDLVFPQQGDDISVSCSLGEGVLPTLLESAVSSMRKEEECLIICPTSCCQCSLLSDQLLATSADSEYLEFFVKLEDFFQVRDLMGDGKTFKRIVRKGRGEFPIDCPLEDTVVSIRTKICTAAQKVWLPILVGSDPEKPPKFDLGMAELPERVEAAVHVMLPGEISILKTTFEGDLVECLSKDVHFECKEEIEIELELVEFAPVKHLDSLQPDEKLSRATLNKEQGNKLFKMNKIRHARAKYQKALKCVGKSYEFEGSEQESRDIKIACMLNLAACAQKETMFGEAIDWCNKILE